MLTAFVTGQQRGQVIMSDFKLTGRATDWLDKIETEEDKNESEQLGWDEPRERYDFLSVSGFKFKAGTVIKGFTLLNQSNEQRKQDEIPWFVKCNNCGEVSKVRPKSIVANAGKCAYCVRSNGNTIIKPCVECGLDIHTTNKLSARKLCLICTAKRKQQYQVKNRKDTFEGKVVSMLRTIKSRSKSKGIGFDLDINYVFQKLKDLEFKCEKSGLPLDISPVQEGNAGVTGPRSLSFDRRDPTKGYTKENTQFVCYHYNVAKNVFSEEELLILCRGVLGNDSGRISEP